MKKIFRIALFFLISLTLQSSYAFGNDAYVDNYYKKNDIHALGQCEENKTYVRGYYKKNGTYVRGHCRRKPNNNVYDNYKHKR